MKKNLKAWISVIAIVIAMAGYFLTGPNEQEISTYEETTEEVTEYSFRNAEYLESHYDKHGIDMGYDSAEEYLAGANQVVSDGETLHKIEAEDGDDVYYRESTNEFVVISSDGYIRTYFCPDDGIEYFNRQ